MATKPDHHALYEIAEGQSGYFTAKQAREAGFSRERLSYYAKRGRFLRVQHGIYRLAQFPGSPFEDLFVAQLRTGPESVISHDSALAVYELSDALPRAVHVTVPRTASRRRKGLQLHTNRLDEVDITSRGGLQITTVARTIADVAASGMSRAQVEQAVRQALRGGLATEMELSAMGDRRGGRLKRILDAMHELEGVH